ncbi:MAG: response regulator [Pirellulaceae bacterium]|nr:response regulator [Pirellulaceae bacterium]MDP6719351.1 response regulator [Pirellulaceae bacterium]
MEDSPVDAKIACIALDRISTEHRVHRVANGDEAMAFLRRHGEYEDAPEPDLILLDLNLPIKDGREVLAEIRADPKLKSLVVVILTSSDCAEDVRACYQLNCNAYLTKRLKIGDLMETFKTIERFFFEVAILPTDT